MATANIKIGPVRLTVDPDQISVVDNKVNTAVPGLRSNTPRTVNTGKSTIAIRMSAIFPDAADINTKLRNIIAYFRAVPFNTIKSDVINRLVSTKIIQRTADDSNTLDSTEKAAARLTQRFETSMVALISNTLVDQTVKDYFVSRGWSLPRAIKNYIGSIESDLNTYIERLSSDSIMRTLGSKFIELNYALAKVKRSKIGNTPSEQISILRRDLRKIIADTASDAEVETRSQSLSEGIKRLTSVSQIEDGDTIFVDGITYRFLGVDAFETLRPGSSSGPGQDRRDGREKYWAEEAKKELARVFFNGPGNRFQLTVKGSDNYGRKLAEITMIDTTPGVMTQPNVSLHLIEKGMGLPSAISAAGRYTTVEDVPYLQKALASSNVGIWRDSSTDIQLPSLWRGFAKNTNNFDPDDPNYLRPNLLPHTVRQKVDLRALMEALVEEFKGLVGNKRDDFVPQALALLIDYNASKAATTGFTDALKGIGVEAIGFPDDIIPVAFAGINYIATPQLPGSIQAEFTFFLFNHQPYMPRLTFLADKINNTDNETTYLTDPDITYARPLADRIRKEYTGDEAVHSPDYLDRYQGELNLSINYKEIVLEEFSRGLLNKDLIADRPTPPEQVQKSRELNDKVLRPVLKDKIIRIAPDDDPSPLRVATSNGNTDVMVISDLQLESVAVNLVNNVIAIPIESSPVPTVQHMGSGVSTAMLEFSTRSMDTVIAFRTVDSTIQEAAKLGNQHKIPTSFTLRNTTINMGGVRDFVFDNIIISTDANIPDKYNIKLVLTESTNTEVSATERLIPQFQQEFANPGKAVDKMLKVIKEQPDHPFVEEFLGTFLPSLEGDRARKFPLPLIFTHTKDANPDTYRFKTTRKANREVSIWARHFRSQQISEETAPVLSTHAHNAPLLDITAEEVDMIGDHNKDDNKRIIEEFLGLVSPNGLRHLLKARTRALDNIWKTNPRTDVQEINAKFHTAQEREKQGSARNVVGPWGFGPGAAFNNTDALSDRWSRYVTDAGSVETIISKTLNVVAGLLADKPKRNRNYGQKMGEQAHNMGRIIRRWYDEEKLPPDVFVALLKYMFDEALLSKEFENFLAGWLSFQVGIFGDLLEDIVPPNIEAIAYRDLKLPTYRDIFSSSNVVLKSKRKDLISHMRALLPVSTWLKTTFDIEALEQAITLPPDRFAEMANRTIGTIEQGIEEPTSSDELSIIRLFELVEDLFGQETNKAGTAGSSRYGGPVSKNNFPTYRDLGIPVPAGLKETDAARVADDFVEPGWMYGTGYLNTWDELSRTTDLQTVFKDVHGKDETTKKKVDPNKVIAAYSEKAGGEELSEQEDEGWWQFIKRKYSESDPLSYLRYKDKEEDEGESSEANKANNSRTRHAVAKQKGIKAANEAGKKKLGYDAETPEKVIANTQWNDISKTDFTKHTASTDRYKEFYYKSMGRSKSPDRDIDSIEHAQAAFRNMGKGKEITSMRNAYPGYAIYFLEEDAEDWGYLDDYYRYDAVISWDVVQAKDIPDVATIRFINYKGVLTNEKTEYDVGSGGDVVGVDSTVKRTLETLDPRYGNRRRGQFGRNDEHVVTAFKLRPGTRLVIKAGYTTKVEEMETLFTGQVAECIPGDITTVVCQSYVSQLMGTMNAHWNRNKDNFPEIVQEMLRDTTYFGRWERFVPREKGQNKVFNGSWSQKVGSFFTRAQYGKNIGELFPDTSDDNIYIRNDESSVWDYIVNWIRDDGWTVKGPPWYNLLTMPRYMPNTVIAARPYDGRSTLFFGSPDSFYIHTNRYPGNPRFWKSEALKEVFRGGLKNGNKSYNNTVRGLMQASPTKSGSPYVMIDKKGNGLEVKRFAHVLYGLKNYVTLSETVKGLPKPMIQALFSIWIKSFYEISFGGRGDVKFGSFKPSGPEIKLIRNNKVAGGLPGKFKLKNIGRGVFTGVGSGLTMSVNGLATYLKIFKDRKLDTRGGTKIADLVLEKASALIKKIGDEYSNYSNSSASDKGYKALKTIISRIIESGDTGIKQPRNRTLRLRAGYVVVNIDDEIDTVYNVRVNMEDRILIAFMHEFVPMLYGIRTWADNNPFSAVADLIKLGDEISAVNVAPNERPFRESHLALSGYNIVRNGIVASMAHSANTVTITNGDDQATESMPVTDSLITKHPKLVYDINAVGGIRKPIKTQAVMSALGEELRKMYRGQLALLGNPKIRPYHMVRVDDHYNLMYGSVEADRVIHSFNQQSGYTTNVVPHMIVRVAEDLGYKTAVWHNVTSGMRTLAWLTASVGTSLAFKGAIYGAIVTGPPGWLSAAVVITAGLAVGAYAGATDTYYNVLEGNKQSYLLGVPFPSLSSQGRYDESRLNPVQIMPLAYRGAPYTVGLDGWDPSTWTIAKKKQHFTDLREMGMNALAEDFRNTAVITGEAIRGISEATAQITGELKWMR